MDDVIGNTTYIELADGTTVTIEPLRLQVLFVLPGKGAHLFDAADALKLGAALLEAAMAAALDPKLMEDD